MADQLLPPNPPGSKPRRKVGCGCKKRQEWLVKQAKALAQRVGFLEAAVGHLAQEMQADQIDEQAKDATLSEETVKAPRKFIRK